MARKKGSLGKGPRAKARSAYETYSDWYDEYTKGEKAGWFDEKLTEEEFEAEYQKAKEMGLPNPARSVARGQELVSRDFEKKYKQLYNEALPNIKDPKAREAIFKKFTDEWVAAGLSLDEARDLFNEYFY